MIAETFVSERVGNSACAVPALIQSTCKAEKKVCVFFPLERNRELEVLCSFHSIAFEAEATRSDAAQGRVVITRRPGRTI